MEIKVLGPGCDECAYTVALVEKIARGAGVAFTHHRQEQNKGGVLHLVSRKPIPWRCGLDGWKIFKQYHAARPTTAAAYSSAK